MTSYKTLYDINNILEPHGFHSYAKTPFDKEHVAMNYQKKYTDDKGIKYFINAKIWDWTRFPQLPEDYVIEFNGQYYQAGTHNAVNFTFLDWSVDQVESWIESLFNAGFIEYYELYD